MGVGVDQPRQEPCISQVNDFRARHLQLGRRRDLLDAVALDEHRHPFPRRIGLAVDEVRSFDDDALRRVRCSGFAWRLRQKKDEKKHGRKRSHATNARATAPIATRAAVSRAEARSKI